MQKGRSHRRRAGENQQFATHSPSRTLAEQFQAPLAAILDLLNARAGSDNEQSRADAEMATVAGIARILTVANDAMLESASAEIDPEQLVEALDSMRRLAFQAAHLTRDETTGSADVVCEIRSRVELWLRRLRDQTDSGVVSLTPLRDMVADSGLPVLETPQPSLAGVIHLMKKLDKQLSAVSRR